MSLSMASCFENTSENYRLVLQGIEDLSVDILTNQILFSSVKFS